MSEYVSANELAKLTGKSRQWIAALCRAGRLPGAVLDGKVWRIDPLAVLPENAYVVRRRAKRERLTRLAQERGAAVGKAYRDEDRYTDSPYAIELRTEIDGWIDQGCEIDRAGVVWREGERVGRVVPFGAGEMRYYEASRGLAE